VKKLPLQRWDQWLCVASFVFPTVNVLKVVHHEYPPAFSIVSVMP